MRARPLLLVLLLLAFVLLPAAQAGAGASRPCWGPFLDQATVDVGTKENCFAPAVARVDVGDTVTWRNTDGVPHNVTTSAGFGGDLPPKQDYSHRFTEPGVYPYACTLHPGMVGAVVVGDGMPVEAELASATIAGTGTGSGPGAVVDSSWWAVAGALALLVGVWTVSVRTRRQRPDGSAAS